LILEKLIQDFGIDAVLDRIALSHPKLEFYFKKIIFTLVVYNTPQKLDHFVSLCKIEGREGSRWERYGNNLVKSSGRR